MAIIIGIIASVFSIFIVIAGLIIYTQKNPEIVKDSDLVIINQERTNNCLDSSGDNVVRFNPCNNGDFQKWHKNLAPGSDVYHTIKHNKTNKCLNSTISGVLTLEKCAPENPSQRWRVLRKFMFNERNTGICIDGYNGSNNGTGIFMGGCNLGDFQKMNLTKPS